MRILFPAVLFILFIVNDVFPQLFEEIIRPVNIPPGESDTLLIDDFYFSEEYNHVFDMENY